MSCILWHLKNHLDCNDTILPAEVSIGPAVIYFGWDLNNKHLDCKCAVKPADVGIGPVCSEGDPHNSRLR